MIRTPYSVLSTGPVLHPADRLWEPGDYAEQPVSIQVIEPDAATAKRRRARRDGPGKRVPFGFARALETE